MNDADKRVLDAIHVKILGSGSFARVSMVKTKDNEFLAIKEFTGSKKDLLSELHNEARVFRLLGSDTRTSLIVDNSTLRMNKELPLMFPNTDFRVDSIYRCYEKSVALNARFIDMKGFFLDPHRYLGSVFGVIDRLHAGNLVHDDLKPANIFFDTSGEAFYPTYVGDWGGASKLTREGFFRTGTTLGTPNIWTAKYGHVDVDHRGFESFKPITKTVKGLRFFADGRFRDRWCLMNTVIALRDKHRQCLTSETSKKTIAFLNTVVAVLFNNMTEVGVTLTGLLMEAVSQKGGRRRRGGGKDEEPVEIENPNIGKCSSESINMLEKLAMDDFYITGYDNKTVEYDLMIDQIQEYLIMMDNYNSRELLDGPTAEFTESLAHRLVTLQNEKAGNLLPENKFRMKIANWGVKPVTNMQKIGTRPQAASAFQTIPRTSTPTFRPPTQPRPFRANLPTAASARPQTAASARPQTAVLVGGKTRPRPASARTVPVKPATASTVKARAATASKRAPVKPGASKKPAVAKTKPPSRQSQSDVKAKPKSAPPKKKS